MNNLHPHQTQAVEWLRTPGRMKCILADDMRLGKTRSAAYAYMGRTPIIIICPAFLKFHWRDEFHAVAPHLKVEIASGRKYLFNKENDVFIINYELLPYVKLPKFKSLIVDEAHRIKSPEAKRTVKVIKFLRYATYACCLTGTPMPSRPIELWSMLYGLGIVDYSWTSFAYRFANAFEAPYGFDTSGASNLSELESIVSPNMLRRLKKDVLNGYKEPEYKIISFDRLPDERESAYDVSQLCEHANPLLAFEGLSEVVKLSALKKVPDSIEFISSLVEDAGKVIVFAYHKEVIELLRQGLEQYNPVVVTGATSPLNREKAKTTFNTDPSCKIFIGNILAAGEGIDLSVADTVVFVETTWVPKDIEQAANRTESMKKLGQSSSVYFLTTEASIDHYMLKRIMEKSEVIGQVIKPTKKENSMNETLIALLERIAVALEKMANAPAAVTLEPKAAANNQVAEEAPAKPKRAKKEKAAEEVKPQAEVQDKPAEEKEITLDDVRTALIKFGEAHGRDKAKEILESRGVQKLGALPPEKFREVYQATQV